MRALRPATGGAVGRTDDGQVVFLRHALPNEFVRATVSEVAKSFVRADTTSVIEASSERVTPPCRYAHAGGCGGCDLQHASTEAQLEWKSQLVTEHLSRIAHLEWRVDVEEVGVPAQGSRTRLRCGVDENGRLGLRPYRSNELVTIDECWISASPFADAFDEEWPDAEEVELRAIGDTYFAVARHDVGEESQFAVSTLGGAPLPADTSTMVRVGAHDYRVGPLSFWQSHRAAPDVLVRTVMKFADVAPGDHVVDLYSGVGLFTVPLAAAAGPTGRVTSVESSEDAVADAEFNTRHFRTVTLRDWRVTPRAINDTVSAGDVVVLDPPRNGAGKAVASALVRRAPRRIVYVSCDAATFARDLAVLLEGGYRLLQLRAFDLFPMTEHVELVGVLDAPL